MATTTAALNIDLSHWSRKLRASAIQLVIHLDVWEVDPGTDPELLRNKKFSPDMSPRTSILRVTGAVGLEYLVKAACLERKLDIFAAAKKSPGPYPQAISAPDNPWLAATLASKNMTLLGHINTVQFEDCITVLRADLDNDPPSTIKHGPLLDDVKRWKDDHRNRDCHVAVGVLNIDEYDHLMQTFNSLIKLCSEHPKS